MRYLLAISAVALHLFTAPALALDKVDPYICPTASGGSGIDCFLEAVPQTYTMCRQVKSIEVIEFGLAGAQKGVNGAKTDSCIEKHKLSVARPYQAALKEAGSHKDASEGLRKLHGFWLESLAKLIPDAADTEEGYKQRVVRPYGEFNDEIKAIRVAQTTALGMKPVVAKGETRKSKVDPARAPAVAKSKARPAVKSAAERRDSTIKP
jgi:hypothetical protein